MIMNLVSQTDVLKAYGEGNNPTRIDFLQEVDVPGVIKYDTSTTVAKEDMSLSDSFTKMLKEEQVYTNPTHREPIVTTAPVYGHPKPVMTEPDNPPSSSEADLDKMLEIASAPRLVLEIPKAPTEAVIEENKNTMAEEEDRYYL